MFLKTLFSLNYWQFTTAILVATLIAIISFLLWRRYSKVVKRGKIYKTFLVAVPALNVIISIILFINIVLPGVIYEIPWIDFIFAIGVLAVLYLFSVLTYLNFKLIKAS